MSTDPEGQMPDPKDCDDLAECVQATGEEEVKKQEYLIKRAVSMDCMECIPDHWGVEINGDD